MPLASSSLAKALFFLTLAILIRCTGDSLAIVLVVECSLLVFAARQGFPSRVLDASRTAGRNLSPRSPASFATDRTPELTGAARLVAVLLMGNSLRLVPASPALTLPSLTLALSGVGLGSRDPSEAAPRHMGGVRTGFSLRGPPDGHHIPQMPRAGVFGVAGRRRVRCCFDSPP